MHQVYCPCYSSLLGPLLLLISCLLMLIAYRLSINMGPGWAGGGWGRAWLVGLGWGRAGLD